MKIIILPLISEPYVPYVISVSASTRAGVGEAKEIIAFTKEGGIVHTSNVCELGTRTIMYVHSIPTIIMNASHSSILCCYV